METKVIIIFKKGNLVTLNQILENSLSVFLGKNPNTFQLILREKVRH